MNYRFTSVDHLTVSKSALEKVIGTKLNLNHIGIIPNLNPFRWPSIMDDTILQLRKDSKWQGGWFWFTCFCFFFFFFALQNPKSNALKSSTFSVSNFLQLWFCSQVLFLINDHFQVENWPRTDNSLWQYAHQRYSAWGKASGGGRLKAFIFSTGWLLFDCPCHEDNLIKHDTAQWI